MQTWPELRREIDERDLGGRRARAERAAFEKWCALSEDRVLAALARTAATRAAALARDTGLVVRTPEGGFELIQLGRAFDHQDAAERKTLSVDAMVLRAFELLVSAHPWTSRASS